MGAADPCARHCAQVINMIDSVELIHSEHQLDDVCRINDAALTAEERIRWTGWQHARAGELRGHVRIQGTCAVLGGVAATLAWLFTAIGDLSTGRGPLKQMFLLATSIALCGTAVLAELDMAHHVGYQPWPVRFGLGGGGGVLDWVREGGKVFRGIWVWARGGVSGPFFRLGGDGRRSAEMARGVPVQACI